MDEKEILKKFGFNVKVERMKRDITQAELAEILDVHEKYISRIETGKQNVTIKTLNKLSTALNIDCYKFLKF
ncbi:MAG: helix-turn-helix transcriptional regulator [Candidatus Gastranaerophilaceae bacterium]